ncbi:hypothetical protein HKX48_004680, partial [Thoreauomyces humboldtii]
SSTPAKVEPATRPECPTTCSRERTPLEPSQSRVSRARTACPTPRVFRRRSSRPWLIGRGSIGKSTRSWVPSLR